MTHLPEYGEEIIVLVKFNDVYSYYLSNKEYWILDNDKWGEGFETDSGIFPGRRGFEVLDSNNWPEFKKTLEKWEVSTSDLSQMILDKLPLVSWTESSELFPVLLIDFDSKKLFSLFPEPLSFEAYVPDKWVGVYDDFYDLVPEVEKYWIIGGVNYFPNE